MIMAASGPGHRILLRLVSVSRATHQGALLDELELDVVAQHPARQAWLAAGLWRMTTAMSPSAAHLGAEASGHSR